MKKCVIAFSLVLLLCSAAFAQNYHDQQARPTPEWFRSGVIYQLAPRSFTAEGTLKAAEKHLERLKDLGVNVVYLLPVNVADTDMDRTKWSPRQIKSGFNDPRNPYRAGDYFHVDPEYGTDQDLKDFIERAHSLGMKVLLDMVFAHCGPGAQVVRQHPEYFKQDKDGKMKLTRWKFPMFDHNNIATRTYQIGVMTYYVSDFNVDGFRCDVADNIPVDFWEEARAHLDKLDRDLVLVAEGKKRSNTRYAFDANYNWAAGQNFIRKMLHGDSKIKERGGVEGALKAYEAYIAACPQGTLLMNMTENHDTATDSFDDRAECKYGHSTEELGLAFCFALDGIPFIYTGQEVCHAGRQSLFGHKDCWIDWDAEYANEYAKDRTRKIQGWVEMRAQYSALTHGTTTFIDNDCPATVCSFLRSDGSGKDVIFIGNFSAEETKVRLADGRKFKLEPWGYVFEAVR